MTTLLLLFSCLWMFTGGICFITSSRWDFTAFDRPEFLLFAVLWTILGAVITGIVTLGFLHLPTELQRLVRSGADIFDTLPARQTRASLDEDAGLLTLKNAVIYAAVDPFGRRAERAQADDHARWQHTQALHD